MEDEAVAGTVVKRTEKRYSLNMVPVKMRDENVGVDGMTFELALQLVSQRSESSPAIEYKNVFANANFHAGRISPVTLILRLRSGYRSANSPKLNAHSVGLTCNLATSSQFRQFPS